jgi:hypothetical protein
MPLTAVNSSQFLDRNNKMVQGNILGQTVTISTTNVTAINKNRALDLSVIPFVEGEDYLQYGA